jgi:methionyl-tRNA formyltransferase
MKVVILGKGLMLANLILGVQDAGGEIAGVFRYEDTKRNKLKGIIGDCFNPSPEVTLIKRHKLRQIRMKSANSEEFQKLMIKLNVDLIIVGTWKEKISAKTFNIPRIATVNIHPSLLPKYRGPNPYMQTILHGEEFSGVTIHLMDEQYDSGAILKQEQIRIFDNDTSKELRERTTRKARELIYEFIRDLNEKILTPVKQDDRYATYFPHITGEEMMLDFTMQTSVEISRTIRALHPFLPSYITYNNVFFITNPYSFKILEQEYPNLEPNTIIAKNPDKKSVTIVCKDHKAIVFSNLKLYKRKFVKNYIKKEVEVYTETVQ